MRPKVFLKKFIPIADVQKYSPYIIAEKVIKLAAQAMHIDEDEAKRLMENCGYVITEHKHKRYINILPEHGNELYYLLRSIPKTTSIDKYNRLRKKQELYLDLRTK